MNSGDMYIPTVLDFAYDIINLHKENTELRARVEHLEELNRIHEKGRDQSLEHNNSMIGTILSAVLDPESNINKADRIIIENELTTNH